MTLTPSDIEQKTFSTALRGYNLDEVDDFLDEIVRTMRKLHEELDEARAGKTTAPATVIPAPAPPPEPVVPDAKIDESAVGKVLVVAQETAERILEEARGEAEKIVESAQAEADSYDEEREKRKEEANRDLSLIDGLVTKVKSDLSELAASVGVDLDAMANALDEAAEGLDAIPEAGGNHQTSEADGEESDSDDDDSGPALYDQDEYEFENNSTDATEGDDAAGTGDDGEGDVIGSNSGSGSGGSTDGSDDDGGDEKAVDDTAEDEYFNYPEGDDDDDVAGGSGSTRN